AAERLRTAHVHLRVLVGEHDRSIADPDLGVPDPPAGLRQTHRLRRAERLLVELDGAGRVLAAQVRRRARVWVHFSCHGSSPSGVGLTAIVGSFYWSLAMRAPL